jgi:hypothetical protein
MFDINYIKQEELLRKISLLKQVKVTLESVMFDRSSNGSSNFAHGFNGVITIFCRYILAILEDGIIGKNPFLFSSSSSLSSSPTTSYGASPYFMQHLANTPSTCSSPNSRKATLNSATSCHSQALWSFVLYVFNEYSLQSNENDEAKKALRINGS